MRNYLRKHKNQIFSLILIVALSSILRLSNLGYSEFQDDEKKARINHKDGTTREFLLNQRKGPLQFFVTEATSKVINDSRNELGFRIPFALVSILSVFAFYLVLSELFENEAIRLFGSLLFSTNGFFVGFGRIVQYQNLNLLFSLLALFMFIKLSKSSKLSIVYALTGTFFFSLSVLTHWDAIFFVFPIGVYYLKFVLSKNRSHKKKLVITLTCFVIGCLVLLPYLIPYKDALANNSDNIKYFNRRVGISSYQVARHKFIFELYNPYFTFIFYSIMIGISLFTLRRSKVYVAWFILNFVLIRYFMQKPGTHIYNYVIPVIFMCAFALNFILNIKHVKYIALPLIIFSTGFTFFQSYRIFVDHRQEYPWDKKVIFSIGNRVYATSEYIDKEVLAFGFPHFRNWKEINKIVQNDPDNCSYITNEGKEISQIYMNASYGIKKKRRCYYIVVVKRPFITGERGARYYETMGRTPIYTYFDNESNEAVVKVFKIYQKTTIK